MRLSLISTTMVLVFLSTSELRAEEPVDKVTTEVILDKNTEAEGTESATGQIVVITAPMFVPISQYFATDLNNLPPSSSGQEAEVDHP